MDIASDPVLRLAADLIAIDSRSALSNLPVAERIEQELSGFEVERIDYHDAAGTPKRALVAHKGPKGGFALSGHMDTVPATGWESAPWTPRIDAAGLLHGLGSVDMKGQVAACIVAAQRAAADVPVTLLITTDEETTKQGAKLVAVSGLAKSLGLRGIVVAEPTSLVPVRGHRSHIAFTAIARGLQAHSSTGKGTNANWRLLPFLVAMRSVFDELNSNPALQDRDYTPPFSDFNLVIDNHGTAMNVTVGKATASIKFRYSAKIDPTPVLRAVREAASDAGVELAEQHEGFPPELPADHPLIALAVQLTGNPPTTAPYGTDASELQQLAPCVVLGPGDIGTAHTPKECVRAQDLVDAVAVFGRVLDAGK